MNHRFARITEPSGKVQWINLDHVRQLVVTKALAKEGCVTNVHIGNSWVERVVVANETPEDILGQS